jgi:glucosylceramidase
MLNESTRREFLKSSALGIAAVTVTGALSNAAGENANGEIKTWFTDDTRRFSPGETLRWRTAASTRPAIELYPEKKHQPILGFGAAFTDASCYMFNQLPPAAREKLFHELFHPSEMRLNVCRTCIGSSDYSTTAYTYDEGDSDPELKRFSIEHDRQYILPMLREARKANPDLFLFSSPWTPPGWMKVGGSMLGGSMRRGLLPVYAEYFVKFLQAYQAEGVTIQAVTPQNEVDTDQDGRMPACLWPQEYEIEFVRALGPRLERNGLKTKIWVIDHNYNLWGRAVAELDDTGLSKYCNAIAWHGYVGKPEMMSRVHEYHPDAEMYWTEGGPDYASPDYLTDWAKWGKTFTGILRNWCRSITAWNLALDEKGRPNIGPFPCGGLVTINSGSHEITRSGQYWAFAHFSRSIERGALRIDSQSTLSDVHHVAFENLNGKKVLVLTNSGEKQTITLRLRTSETLIPMAKNSVATLTWS